MTTKGIVAIVGIGVAGAVIITSCLVLKKFPHIKVETPSGSIEVQNKNPTSELEQTETEIEWSPDLL